MNYFYKDIKNSLVSNEEKTKEITIVYMIVIKNHVQLHNV
jgi:hypothetical protein